MLCMFAEAVIRSTPEKAPYKGEFFRDHVIVGAVRIFRRYAGAPVRFVQIAVPLHIFKITRVASVVTTTRSGRGRWAIPLFEPITGTQQFHLTVGIIRP